MSNPSPYFPPPDKADPYNFVHDLDGHFANWAEEGTGLYRIWFKPPTTPDWIQVTIAAPVVKKRVQQFEGAGCKNVTVEKILHRDQQPYTRAQRKAATERGI